MSVTVETEQLPANQYAFEWFTQWPIWLDDAQPYGFMQFSGLAGTLRAVKVQAKDRGYGTRTVNILKSGAGAPDLNFATVLPNTTVNGTQTLTPSVGSQNLDVVSTAGFPTNGAVIIDGTFVALYNGKTATQLQNVVIIRGGTPDIPGITVGDEFAEQIYLQGVGVYTLTFASGASVVCLYYSECGQIQCAGVGFQSDFNPTAFAISALADGDAVRQDFLTQHGGRDVTVALNFTIP